MKDEEIIVALDRCGYLKDCADCPLNDMGSVDKCMHTLLINALDLINRLKADKKELEAMLRQQAEIIDILKIACEEKNKEIKGLKKNKEMEKALHPTNPDDYPGIMRHFTEVE